MTTSPTRPFDIEAIRADFPILSQQVYGKPLVYLDNAASAQKPEPPDTGSARSDLIQLVLRLKSVLLDSDSGAMLPAMLSAARENPEVREALERFTSARRSPTVQVIRRGIERGEIRADVEPELLADMLVGAVIYRLLMRNGTIGDRRAEELVDLVLGGARA